MNVLQCVELHGGGGDAGGDIHKRNTENGLLAGVNASETAARKEEMGRRGDREEKLQIIVIAWQGAFASISSPQAGGAGAQT